MTDEKIIRILKLYIKSIVKEYDLGGGPHEMPDHLKQRVFCEIPTLTHRDHLIYMCKTAIRFVREGRRDKAFRWLGFIQGSLYTLGFFTIDDLKNHSRPDDEDGISE